MEAAPSGVNVGFLQEKRRDGVHFFFFLIYPTNQCDPLNGDRRNGNCAEGETHGKNLPRSEVIEANDDLFIPA